jgi:hypothetical protein
MQLKYHPPALKVKLFLPLNKNDGGNYYPVVPVELSCPTRFRGGRFGAWVFSGSLELLACSRQKTVWFYALVIDKCIFSSDGIPGE